jgi:hypothetical protein
MAKLPPKYANEPTWLLYELDLPKTVRLTALRIYGLGWRYKYERTDPWTIEELCAICELKRSQFYGHIQQLVVKGVLRYTSTAGVFVFDLRPSSMLKELISPENWTEVTVHDDDPIPVVSMNHHHQYSSCIEGGSGGEAAQSGKLDRRRLEIVDRVGIDEPTRSEIAELPWCTVEYLTSWTDWFESQTDKGVGWLVLQIRKACSAPEPIIEDRTRYVTGQYADLIER